MDGILQQETSATLNGPFVSGENVSCTVLASDESGQGEPQSSSVIIKNSPPVVQSISFETQEIYTDDIIFASAEVTDLDGDSVLINYDWYVDGSLVKSGLSSSLDGSTYFEKNQEVLLVVTGSDASLSSEVFVFEFVRNSFIKIVKAQLNNLIIPFF